MNLFKIKSSAVKTVKAADASQSLSIESMKKLMGGGGYGAHCCNPNKVKF